jgi:hypothetical protein
MHIDKDLYKFCNLGDRLKYVNPKYYQNIFQIGFDSVSEYWVTICGIN